MWRAASWRSPTLSRHEPGGGSPAAGMDRQTLRDWVVRYNEHGIDGLADRWGDGRPPTLTRKSKPS